MLMLNTAQYNPRSTQTLSNGSVNLLHVLLCLLLLWRVDTVLPGSLSVLSHRQTDGLHSACWRNTFRRRACCASHSFFKNYLFLRKLNPCAFAISLLNNLPETDQWQNVFISVKLFLRRFLLVLFCRSGGWGWEGEIPALCVSVRFTERAPVLAGERSYWSERVQAFT